MDQAVLVSLDVETGSQVLARLDECGIDAKVALWMVTPEYEDGRLVLASQNLSQLEPLKAYRAVVKALSGSSVPPLTPILILKMKDPFIRALRERFAKASSVSGMRLGGQMIGNRYVSDAYVYRIR